MSSEMEPDSEYASTIEQHFYDSLYRECGPPDTCGAELMVCELPVDSDDSDPVIMYSVTCLECSLGHSVLQKIFEDSMRQVAANNKSRVRFVEELFDTD